MNKHTTAEFDTKVFFDQPVTPAQVITDANRAIEASITALAEQKEMKRLRKNEQSRFYRARNRAYYANQSYNDCCGGGRSRHLRGY